MNSAACLITFNNATVVAKSSIALRYYSVKLSANTRFNVLFISITLSLVSSEPPNSKARAFYAMNHSLPVRNGELGTLLIIISLMTNK